MKKIIVIGAGASGLMAAITAARKGAEVLVLEHENKPGKKLLITGNGRCNLTNEVQRPNCYRSADPEFPLTVLKQFTMQDTMLFFDRLGIYTVNKNGWIYPITGQASCVLEVLLMEAVRWKIKIKYTENVIHIASTKSGFLAATDTYKYYCDSVILAAGSKASQIKGADGSGYALAEKLGHRIMEPLPALVQLKCSHKWVHRLSGVRMDAAVHLNIGNGHILTERGELQFTSYGISGIPIFQISGLVVKKLIKQKNVLLTLDFMPDFSENEMKSYLLHRIDNNTDKSISQILIGLLHEKVISVLHELTGLDFEEKAQDIKEQMHILIHAIKNTEVRIDGSNSFLHAQVCQGGVDTAEINPQTMESKLISGLYFAGEIVDVDGICGGYNLQWAWSSGYVSGREAALSEHKESII